MAVWGKSLKKHAELHAGNKIVRITFQVAQLEFVMKWKLLKIDFFFSAFGILLIKIND